jgi:hypothetical protein
MTSPRPETMFAFRAAFVFANVRDLIAAPTCPSAATLAAVPTN